MKITKDELAKILEVQWKELLDNNPRFGGTIWGIKLWITFFEADLISAIELAEALEVGVKKLRDSAAN